MEEFVQLDLWEHNENILLDNDDKISAPKSYSMDKRWENLKRSKYFSNLFWDEGEMWRGEPPQKVFDIAISKLKLNDRAYNLIKNYEQKIGTPLMLSDFAFGDSNYLEEFENLDKGATTLLVEMARQYIVSTEEQQKKVHNHSEEAFSTQESEILFPEYVVIENVIFHKNTGAVIDDIAIDKIGLSVGTYNFLGRNNLLSLKSLLKLSKDELQGFPGLGRKRFEDVKKCVNQYLENCLIFTQNKEAHGVPNLSEGEMKKIACSIRCKEEEQIKEIQEVEELYQLLLREQFNFLSIDDIINFLPSMEPSLIHNSIDNMLHEGRLEKTKRGYRLQHKSWVEEIENYLLDSDPAKRRIGRVITMRKSGKTLQRVADVEGISVSYIQIIERKWFNKIRKAKREAFMEEEYAKLFRHYSLNQDFFENMMGLPHSTWYYLNVCYKQGKHRPEEAIEDEQLPFEIRQTIMEWLHRKCV